MKSNVFGGGSDEHEEILWEDFEMFNGKGKEDDPRNTGITDEVKQEKFGKDGRLSRIIQEARESGEIHKTDTCGLRYTNSKGETVDFHVNDDNPEKILARVALMKEKTGHEWIEREQCNILDARYRREIYLVLRDAEVLF